MTLRIVSQPLLLGPDGKILSRKASHFAAYILDPLKYTPQGLEEAINAAVSNKRIAQYVHTMTV